MQCILGFKGSFPCVKRDKTAACEVREGEGERGGRDEHKVQHTFHFPRSSGGITCRHPHILSDCYGRNMRAERKRALLDSFQRWHLEPQGSESTRTHARNTKTQDKVKAAITSSLILEQSVNLLTHSPKELFTHLFMARAPSVFHSLVASEIRPLICRSIGVYTFMLQPHKSWLKREHLDKKNVVSAAF